MSGWASGISAGAAALGAGASWVSALQRQRNEGNSLYGAQMNYLLQKEMAAAQQRLAEAGRTDAAGNRVYFNGKDWVTEPTKATKAIIDASQANEREQQVSGGTRREFGQQQNFASRGDAGNQADAYSRMLRDRVGAPTREGMEGRNAIAAATKIGSNNDSLVDAIARNQIRSGSGPNSGDHAIDSLGAASGRDLRTVLAENAAAAPELHRVASEGWHTGMQNRYNPMQAVRSNITDAPFAPTQVGAPIDAALNQAATYGAATSGRGATGLNAAQGYVSASPQTPMPWGTAFHTLSEGIQAYMKNNKSKYGSIGELIGREDF